jgi:CubicO group peptidase (beta-lactamase class C family)
MRKALIIFLILALRVSLGYTQIILDTLNAVKANRQLYAIVVSQNDKIVYKEFFNGKTAQDAFNNQSLTKSVVSLLIGIAIDKGYISSVDEKIVKYFPQFKQDTDKRKLDITIRQVMNQASGLWHEDLDNLNKYFAIANPSSYVVTAPLVSDPGKVFHYNNAATHLLSAIITKSTGMSTLQFANKYLFSPLNIKNVRWDKMNDGYYDGCGLLSVYLHTQDMNKIASLLLHNGYYNNTSIVSEKWIKQILNPDIFYQTPWGFQGSAYALCWYHYSYKGMPVTYALGWGGQFAFVIPGKNAVITDNESVENATAIQAAAVFLDKIFPLIYQQLK